MKSFDHMETPIRVQYRVYNKPLESWTDCSLVVDGVRAAEDFIQRMDDMYVYNFKFIAWVKI